MQHEITEHKPLLNADGSLSEPGYAKRPLLVYDRGAIRAGKLRIKEWDYYLVANDRFALALTIADNGYMGLDSISLLQFERPFQHTKSPMRLLPLGKTGLPDSSEKGDVGVSGKGYAIRFDNDGTRRRLYARMDDFYQGKLIEADITLQNHGGESMVIATPFANHPQAFYYNQKINCLPAQGFVRFDGRVLQFDPADSFAVLDWGRGVWTYRNTWYWGSASGMLDGAPFGFNIGYGFGDTSAASENMLFYRNRAHKLSQVTFHIPQKAGRDDFLSPWRFDSDDGRFTMDFQPILDRAAYTSALVIASDQHQVFGRFTGTAVLDDGTVLHVKDLLGFAEKVANRW